MEIAVNCFSVFSVTTIIICFINFLHLSHVFHLSKWLKWFKLTPRWCQLGIKKTFPFPLTITQHGAITSMFKDLQRYFHYILILDGWNSRSQNAFFHFFLILEDFWSRFMNRSDTGEISINKHFSWSIIFSISAVLVELKWSLWSNVFHVINRLKLFLWYLFTLLQLKKCHNLAQHSSIVKKLLI